MSNETVAPITQMVYCITLLFHLCSAEKQDVTPWYSICLCCDGSLDQSFMVNPLSYISFQPVLHDWGNKGCGMCYPICGMVHIKEPLMLIRKSTPCSCGSRSPLAFLYQMFDAIELQIKCVECIIKTFPSLLLCGCLSRCIML